MDIQVYLYQKRIISGLSMHLRGIIYRYKKTGSFGLSGKSSCKKTLDEADMDESSRAKELDFLKFEVSEIEDAMLKEGEDEELETTFKRMENGRKIAESTAASYAYTVGKPEVQANA